MINNGCRKEKLVKRIFEISRVVKVIVLFKVYAKIKLSKFGEYFLITSNQNFKLSFLSICEPTFERRVEDNCSTDLWLLLRLKASFIHKLITFSLKGLLIFLEKHLKTTLKHVSRISYINASVSEGLILRKAA